MACLEENNAKQAVSVASRVLSTTCAFCMPRLCWLFAVTLLNLRCSPGLLTELLRLAVLICDQKAFLDRHFFLAALIQLFQTGCRVLYRRKVSSVTSPDLCASPAIITRTATRFLLTSENQQIVMT